MTDIELLLDEYSIDYETLRDILESIERLSITPKSESALSLLLRAWRYQDKGLVRKIKHRLQERHDIAVEVLKSERLRKPFPNKETIAGLLFVISGYEMFMDEIREMENGK